MFFPVRLSVAVGTAGHQLRIIPLDGVVGMKNLMTALAFKLVAATFLLQPTEMLQMALATLHRGQGNRVGSVQRRSSSYRS